MSLVPRTLPIYRDVDFWRPSWDLTPQFSSSLPFSSSVPFSSSFFSSPVPYSSSNMTSHFEAEMRRMHDEMNRMFQDMQKIDRPNPIDDWRLTEKFRMDNPIISERDGGRKFKLEFDLSHFKPEEISLRTAGNQLSVHAKHEEKDGSRSGFREYQRQYVLPKDVDPELLVSKLSAGGILSIEAPLPALEGSRDRLIPIDHRK
ncbi:hypothetical protein ACJMK2_038597 [Sinanodonta woodiana]|uniref:SHSP domain-containing protein n=1 Tax=Sinanodonta woodiana TaxID=1069815 RepID=A0ABD3W9H1_SINWO